LTKYFSQQLKYAVS